VNYIPTNIEQDPLGIDAGTLFIETWGGTRSSEVKPGYISREGIRD
jgi:hypothetical protein